MGLENTSPQEDSIHDSLMNILPDDSLNIGQSQEPSEEKPIETADKAETKEPEPTVEDEDVEIEIEGQRYKVPTKLKDSIMMHADYTRKTQELAEQRKSLGDPKQVDEFKQRLTHYETLLGDAVKGDQQKDWIKLLENDPIEYLKQKELATARAHEWQKVSEKQQTELAEKNSQSLNREWEQLLAKRPEWKDEAVRKADREKITKSLTEAGYSKEDVDAIADHRALLIADKARRYDELMNAKTEVVKKIEKLPPKIERPGVTSAVDGQANQAAMQRLRKSGGIDDAAEALRSLMG